MIDRINGKIVEGVWFSQDVVFATLTVTGLTALVDLAATGAAAVGSDLEQIVELLEQRGTVIGLHANGETTVQLILDYGQAFGSSGSTVGNQSGTDVLTEVETQIDAISGLSSAAFTNVGTQFAAV